MTNDEARRLADLTHSLRECGPCNSCQALYKSTIAGIEEAEAKGVLYSPFAIPVRDYDFSKLAIKRRYIHRSGEEIDG